MVLLRRFEAFQLTALPGRFGRGEALLIPRSHVRVVSGHWSEGVFGPAENAGHHLFMVYVRHGPIHQVGDLTVDASAGHVAVLGHRHLGVPEMVCTDSRREPPP